MKPGRPSALAAARTPDEDTITSLMSAGQAPLRSTPAERRIATDRLLAEGVARARIATLLDVDLKTVSRYVRRLQEES